MNTIYFLDFDGVICDSILECFISSYIGYYHIYRNEKPEAMDIERYKKFIALRPFIRRGADYLLLHEILDAGVRCASQREFDQILKDSGQELSDLFHEYFYQVRDDLLEKQREYWLSLNKLYKPLIPHMSGWAASPRVYILSTKKAEFIREILLFNGINWPLERIIYSSNRSKNEIICQTVSENNASDAFFIDDQIDHFKGIDDPRISTALAVWGYIQQEWLHQTRVPAYQINDLIRTLTLK